MLSLANEISAAQETHDNETIQPRLVHLAMEEASWTEEDAIQRMWAGLLASATSDGRPSDENLMFMNILKQLSSLQVQVLRHSVEKASKSVTELGFVMADDLVVAIPELYPLFGVDDLQRLDRELDHLRELGLIGSAFGGGGIDIEGRFAVLTPTSLTFHLYVRSQGSKLPPAEFWQLTPPDDQEASS